MSNNSSRNTIVEEINVYDIIKRVWKYRKFIIIFVFLSSLTTAVYSLIVDEKYQVSCTIVASDTSEETSIHSLQGFAGISLGGKSASPVEKSILLTLRSDTFLETILKEYRGDKRLFDDKLEEIRKKEKDPVIIEQMDRYVGLDILRKSVISHSMNSDYNTISISVKLKDKYFAKEFLIDLLSRLKTYIVNQNMTKIKDDVAYYTDMVKKIDDVVLRSKMEKKIFNKLENQFSLSSNIFTVITKPSIPLKRIYPSRTIMVLLNCMLSTFFAIFIVAMQPLVVKIIKFLKN